MKHDTNEEKKCCSECKEKGRPCIFSHCPCHSTPPTETSTWEQENKDKPWQQVFLETGTKEMDIDLSMMIFTVRWIIERETLNIREEAKRDERASVLVHILNETKDFNGEEMRRFEHHMMKFLSNNKN